MGERGGGRAERGALVADAAHRHEAQVRRAREERRVDAAIGWWADHARGLLEPGRLCRLVLLREVEPELDARLRSGPIARVIRCIRAPNPRPLPPAQAAAGGSRAPP